MVPGDMSLRLKRDAAAQTGASTPHAPPGSKKRVRWAAISVSLITHTLTSSQLFRDDKADDSASHLVKRPVLDIQSAIGPMVIHISTEDYVLHPADLVTEPWVTEQQVRCVIVRAILCTSLPDAARSYIRTFLTYTNADGPWFPIDHAPVPASWAVVHNNPRIMHRVHRDRPILFWVVGSLVDIHLLGIQDAPPPTLQVVVRFLRGRDRAQAIELYNTASSDVTRTMDKLLADSASSADEGTSVSCDCST